MNTVLAFLKSKTVWGAVIGVAGYLYNQDMTQGFLNGADWVQAIGVLVSAIGVKHATMKSNVSAAISAVTTPMVK